MWPTNAFRGMSGRGGGSSPEVAPPPVPIPTPPVTNSAPAVTEVQEQLRKQMLRRKSLGTTLYAAGGMGGALPGMGASPGTAAANAPTKTG